jgi:hypothetical protein
MLTAIAELVAADKLKLLTRSVRAEELAPETLRAALGSHRAPGSAQAFRERSVLVFGDEAQANHLYFELREQIRKLQDAAPADAEPVPLGSLQPAPAAPPAVKPKASQRWGDSTAMLKELKLEQCAAAPPQVGLGRQTRNGLPMRLRAPRSLHTPCAPTQVH